MKNEISLYQTPNLERITDKNISALCCSMNRKSLERNNKEIEVLK